MVIVLIRSCKQLFFLSAQRILSTVPRLLESMIHYKKKNGGGLGNVSGFREFLA